MKFSKRINNLVPSATFAMSARAREMKAQGRDVIALTVGEPDFDTPDYISEAAKKAIDEKFTRYTAEAGANELRDAAAGYFRDNYGVKASGANIIMTNGGKQGIYNTFVTLLDPGDEVVLAAPCWVSYPAMVELADGVPVMASATAKEEFKVSPERLDAFLTPKTKMVLINSPSNPTGSCYSQKEVDALAEWALKKNIILFSDEVYDQLVYPPAKRASFSPWWEKHPENFIITGAVSKSWAMTGWRVGHVLGSPEFIKAMIRFQGQTTSNICSIAQKAAVKAYSGGLETVETMRKAFERRRDIAYKIISGWKNVICPKPQGAFYIFPDVHQLYNATVTDSMSFCLQLLEKEGVALVPGEPFGDDNCVRISYAVLDETLIEALTRMERFIGTLAK